jgi:hypothetical protein
VDERDVTYGSGAATAQGPVGVIALPQIAMNVSSVTSSRWPIGAVLFMASERLISVRCVARRLVLMLKRSPGVESK